MNHTGNQLTWVNDAAADISYAPSADYKDKKTTSGTAEYTYNKNGAMSKDDNKGITEIQYNSLNLPRQMVINSASVKAKNYYTYSASGVKLKTEQRYDPALLNSPIGTTTPATDGLTDYKNTDYAGNIIYETMKSGSTTTNKTRILVDGGYIENNAFYFYLNDHLGNNRVVTNASGTVTQKNHYYPFGTTFAESTSADAQPYKYNGKELDKMHGLNLYDYSARYYESALIRFTTIDPLAEKYYSISPYVYCANNPLRFTDPTGMVIDSTSLADWHDERNAILYMMADLNLKENGGWQKNKDRIASLLKTLGNMRTMESSKTVYTLSKVDGTGYLKYDSTTGNMVVEYNGTANFVHEITHAGQFERGEIGYVSGGAIAHDLYDEVEAYQAQFAYNSFSLPSRASSMADIIPKWVINIKDAAGNKIYRPGELFVTPGVTPLNKNSTPGDFLRSYPSNQGINIMKAFGNLNARIGSLPGVKFK